FAIVQGFCGVDGGLAGDGFFAPPPWLKMNCPISDCRSIGGWVWPIVPPGLMISSSLPGVSDRKSVPSKPDDDTAATVSIGSLMSLSTLNRTTASNVLGSSDWLTTVPTLMPLILTSAPFFKPPTLSNRAVSS